MDAIERIEQGTEFAATKVKGVTQGDLSKPTPCSEFNMRALLNHMIGGLGILTTAAAGGKAEIPEGDQFGTDPAGAYDERRSGLLTAIRTRGVLDRDWEMPFGSMSGTMMDGWHRLHGTPHARLGRGQGYGSGLHASR